MADMPNPPSNWIMHAIIAGLCSALILAGAETGVVLAMLLAAFYTVPLFIAGLSLGLHAIMVSSAVATVAILVASGPVAAMIFAVMSALPAIWLTRLALMSQTVPVDDDEDQQEASDPDDSEDASDVLWYPFGRLIVWAIGIACFGIFGVFTLLEVTEGGALAFLESEAGEVIGAMVANNSEFTAGVDPETFQTIIVRVVLMALGLGWLLPMVVGGTLAQGILERFGRNIRPGFKAEQFVLPRGLLGFVAAAVALCFVSDPWGFLGLSILPILLMPYFLLGLATIHVISRAWPLRELILAALYGSVFFGFWPIVPIAIMGLVEEAMGLRMRFGQAKPD